VSIAWHPRFLDRALHVIIIGQNCLILWDAFFYAHISWAKILFLILSVLVLVLVWRMDSRRHLASQQAIYAPPNPAREEAINRLRELLTKGQYLAGQVPQPSASCRDFCNFWRQQTQKWAQDVGAVLNKAWGQSLEQDFYSTIGLLHNQPTPTGVHDEVGTDLLELNWRLANLDRIRQTLPKS